MSGSNVDIIIRTKTEGAENFKKTEDGIKGITDAAKQASGKEGLGGFGEQAGDAALTLRALAGPALAAAAAVAGVGAAAALAFKELAEHGSEIERIQESYRRLVGAQGESSDAMIAKSREASKGLISDFELMSAANKAVMFGLPITADAMGKLAATAVTLGQAMRREPTAALNDLIIGIGRGSARILDNIGIMVKAEEAYKRYAEAHGTTAESLSEDEQRLAIYSVALEQATKRVSDLGGVQITFADSLKQAGTTVTNLTDELSLMVATSPGVKELGTSLSESVRDFAGEIRTHQDEIRSFLAVVADLVALARYPIKIELAVVGKVAGTAANVAAWGTQALPDWIKALTGESLAQAQLQERAALSGSWGQKRPPMFDPAFERMEKEANEAAAKVWARWQKEEKALAKKAAESAKQTAEALFGFQLKTWSEGKKLADDFWNDQIKRASQYGQALLAVKEGKNYIPETGIDIIPATGKMFGAYDMLAGPRKQPLVMSAPRATDWNAYAQSISRVSQSLANLALVAGPLSGLARTLATVTVGIEGAISGGDAIQAGKKQGGFLGALGVAGGVVGIAGSVIGLFGSLFGGKSKAEKEAERKELEQRKKDAESALASLVERWEAFRKESVTKGVGGLGDLFKYFASQTDLSADRLKNLGVIGVAMFGSLRKSGMSLVDALKAMGPAIASIAGPTQAQRKEWQSYYDDVSKKIEQLQKDFAAGKVSLADYTKELDTLSYNRYVTGKKLEAPAGGDGAMGAAFQGLIDFQALVSGNEDLVKGAEGLGDAITALRVTGNLTQDTFDAIQGTAGDLFDDMIAKGFTSDQAMAVLARTLLGLRDAAKDGKLALDDETKALVDAADKAGLFADLEDPMKVLIGLQEDMVGVLGLVAQAFGVTLPESVQKYIDKLKDIPSVPAAPGASGEYGDTAGGGGKPGPYVDPGAYGARGLIVAPPWWQIPRLAGGGIIPARTGGTPVILGEAGQPELAAPVEALTERIAKHLAAQVGGDVVLMLDGQVLGRVTRGYVADGLNRGTDAQLVTAVRGAAG